jgi:hypothetical protein
MNFNLISPENNGHTFNVRYKEPIVVPPNSKVYLNWATFERDTSFEFKQDQYIEFVWNKVIPFREPLQNNVIIGQDITNVGRLNRNRFYIPSGTYTMPQIQTAITNVLCGGDLNTNNNVFVGGVQNDRGEASIPGIIIPETNSTLRAQLYDCISPNIQINPNGLKLGMVINTSNLANGMMSFSGSAVHNRNSTLANDPDDQTYLPNANGNDVASGNQGDTFRDYSNSYVMCDEKYFHLGTDLRQYESTATNMAGRVVSAGGFDDLKNSNMAVFTTSSKLDDLTGSVGCGLWTMEKSGLSGANQGSNSGATIPLLNAGGHGIPGGNGVQPLFNAVEITGLTEVIVGKIPRTYFWVEVNGNTHPHPDLRETLVVYAIYGREVLTNPRQIYQIGDGAAEFGGSVVCKVRLADYMTNESKVSYGVHLYKKDDSLSDDNTILDDNTDTFVRVVLFLEDGSGVIVYDSDWYNAHRSIVFPQEFFDFYRTDANVLNGSGGAGANGVYTANELECAYRSQMFNWIVAGTTQNEGFHLINSKSFELCRNTGATLHRDFANVMIENYQVRLSPELGSLLNPTSTDLLLPPRFPSMCNYNNGMLYLQHKYGLMNMTNDTNDFYYDLYQIIAQYRNDKFSIMINGLPIKVYKNTNDSSKSGSRKNILANIPNAFQGADVFLSQANGKVIGTFQSSLGVVNDLGNQLFTTNNFDIKVVNMEDETPAKQLTKTIVNFTIQSDYD